MKEENEIIRCNKGARSERGKNLRVIRILYPESNQDKPCAAGRKL